jgi:Spy/CpxP family protein refolding chaperone
MMNRQRLFALFILVAVFASGAAAGGFGISMFADSSIRGGTGGPPPRPDRGGRPPPPGTRGFATEEAVARLQEELDLTPEQAQRVESVFSEQQQAANTILEEMGPSLRATVDSANVLIRSLLSPSQQLGFDELISEEGGILGRRMEPGTPPR